MPSAPTLPTSPIPPATQSERAPRTPSTRSTTSARCSVVKLLALLLTACSAPAPAKETPAPLIEAAGPSPAPLLPRPDLGIYEPLAQDSPELAELARALCPRDMDVIAGETRCMVCPDQTGNAGQDGGALSARVEADRALVTLTGCEVGNRGFGGGTFSMRRAPDGWHTIGYWPHVLTHACEATPYLNMPALWCTGTYTWEGITTQQLWLIRLEPGRDPVELWAPSVDCDVASCREGELECWDEGRWGQADVNNDKMPDVVWEGAYRRWTPAADADLSNCPAREAPLYTLHEEQTRRAWIADTNGWIEHGTH